MVALGWGKIGAMEIVPGLTRKDVCSLQQCLVVNILQVIVVNVHTMVTLGWGKVGAMETVPGLMRNVCQINVIISKNGKKTKRSAI